MDIRKIAMCMLMGAVWAAAGDGGWDTHFQSGETLDRAGRYAAAAAEFERALAEAEGFPKTDWRFSVTLHNLGVVYRQLGRYPEAERCYRRAIEAFECCQVEHKAERASAFFELGALYLITSQVSRAEPLYRRSYDLRLEALGPDHPLVGVSLHGLARVAQERRKWRESEDYYRRAEKVLGKGYGPHSFEVADVLHNWSILLREEKRDDEARPLLERAITIYEQRAPVHPKMAVMLRNMAELEAATGNTAEAARLFGRAVSICDASLPADHPQTGIVLQAYASFLRRTKHPKEAQAVEARARAIPRMHSQSNWAAYTVDVTEFQSRR
jgi:tetratricopeptide (TPR) repeat protein